MEDCFRFLINVDQCLNMSYFDIFFYRLKSCHKFHASNAQLFSEPGDSSLRSAVKDIRLYLDKYPYHVEEFQIVTAMRGAYEPSPTEWSETLLYRLLLLEQELRRARIFINSQEGVDKALNLIMLYDADFSADLPRLEPYMESQRLERDCALLLAQRLPEGESPSDPRSSLAASLLDAFFARRAETAGHIEQIRQHMAEGADWMESEDLCRDLAAFVKEHLFNFQIFEAQIDRNNRRQNILALLRLTEFLNRSTICDGGEANAASLSQRCAANWDAVWKEPDLERRYAAMLRAYQMRLNTAASELERPNFSVGEERDLPVMEIPPDQAITSTRSVFFDECSREEMVDPKKLLNEFMEDKISIGMKLSDWTETYGRCKVFLETMEYSLRECAADLSRQYSETLELRKKESLEQRSVLFTAKPETEMQIDQMEYERDKRLEQLKSPQMTPSLSFQDQLNMTNALEQGDRNIRFFIGCIQAMKVTAFLLAIVLCGVVCFGHYTILQPYVFQDSRALACWIGYIAVIVLMMFFCWRMPYAYFRRRMRKCIQRLQEDAELYITGYYSKAKQFRTYINLLNQLDYITRYHRLLTRAHDMTHRLSQGYLWHKVQIRQHLQKLQFFQGLIELGGTPQLDPNMQTRPAIDGDKVCDVIDSPVYWPQS